MLLFAVLLMIFESYTSALPYSSSGIGSSIITNPGSEPHSNYNFDNDVDMKLLYIILSGAGCGAIIIFSFGCMIVYKYSENARSKGRRRSNLF